MKQKKALSLSRLMVVLVSGVAAVTALISIFVFTTLYTAALRSNAATGSEQSVTQAANAIANYTADTNKLLRRIIGELNSSDDSETLSATFATMVQMRDDLASIGVYRQDGSLIACYADNRRRKASVASLDLTGMEADSTGVYITPPHVQSLYMDYYPWVVSVARPAELTRYGGVNAYVTVDLQFSTIAGYMDDVGIGQRGYSFIIDNAGRLVYHPQQQLIYSGLKSEDTLPLAALPDGVHADGSLIRVIKSLPQGDWRIVGVSYLDELVAQPRQAALGRILAVVPVVLLILLAISVLVSRLVSRPIHGLVDEMRRFEQDAAQFVYQPVSGTDEINVLSGSFEHMVVRIQNLMAEVKSEEETLRKTELKALQAQINPHFLYNTLDSIQWMCEVGRTDEAVQMVSALARLFRISISRGADLIPIRRELEHAESYLIIQKFRYKDQFSYRFDVDESVLDCLCSKITLQPIIENAILHGFGELVEDGEIVISAKADSADVVLTVTDNGIGMDEAQCHAILSHDQSEPGGIGIKNVADRIRIYFGAPYGLSIESEPDRGTRVTIRLPQTGREEP
ncbi:sensor histidine kinase [Agathobaculum sp. NTUH-O15-33]|uniref:sensor histidine kinase n=1 Tax=Agathobaculum sp. NTUH-O15-33 TaxID=3079302 RepID=UPI0029586618|nr:sensor histidine kinase [Agathobaculum sp. NTUH-O15-33]WNX84275.1 sensor histidine kinase [Agathobaculum sp. NTUH-O15-33]